MGYLTAFLEWLLGAVKRSITMCVSVPGMIVVFFGSFATIIVNFLLDLPFFSTMLETFSTLVSHATSLVQSSWMGSNIAQTLLYATNFQQLFLAGTATLSATFGAVAFMTISLLAVILPLIITVYSARGLLKLVSVASGGILSP